MNVYNEKSKKVQIVHLTIDIANKCIEISKMPFFLKKKEIVKLKKLKTKLEVLEKRL